MTFKQLEQFLTTEKWRAGTQQNTDMCGKYARCAYCDRFCDYPCARAYDTLVKKKREGKASVSSWQFPEPDVKEKFGTVFASEEAWGGIAKISIDPEDLFYFSLGGRGMEMYTHPYYGKETGETETDTYPETVYVSLPAVSEDGGEEGGATSARAKKGVLSRKAASDRGTRLLVIKKRVKTNHIKLST